MANQDEVFKKVQTVLVDALGVDEEDVVPTAKLAADLGAESIDYLDIAFRLEKAFGIKIEEGEMLPADVLNDPKYVAGGKVTDLGIAELKQRMPHADLTEFDKSRSVEDFTNVFTVDAVVKFVMGKVK